MPSFFFFFNDTATTEIYTLSLHDALPIYMHTGVTNTLFGETSVQHLPTSRRRRSEEHTSELQSRPHLVCRLLLEKKKKSDKNRLHLDDDLHSALPPYDQYSQSQNVQRNMQ